MSPIPTRGELPEDLAIRVLKAFGDDPKTDLPALLRSTEDATPEQIATVVARWAFDARWSDRMSFEGRNRIRAEIENHFTPPETISDPFVAQGERTHDPFDPWARHAEINDPAQVQTIGQGLPVARIVKDTRTPQERDS